MFRALQNVLQNAMQAAAEGGREVEASYGKSDDGRAEIIVTDNGKGIPEEALTRIGEPCFTTKRQSGGTGLGLFITRMVVESAHGGLFRIGNRQGTGAVAVIRIPLIANV
jgi:signal transduction histidine kinase